MDQRNYKWVETSSRINQNLFIDSFTFIWKIYSMFWIFFVCDLPLKHLARRGEEESKEGQQKGMCGLNLVTIIGWKFNKVTNHELTFTKRSSNRVKCSRTTTKGGIARALMCWARLRWSTPTISATMCRWALFGWNKIILDEYCTGHQQSSEVYRSF